MNPKDVDSPDENQGHIEFQNERKLKQHTTQKNLRTPSIAGSDMEALISQKSSIENLKHNDKAKRGKETVTTLPSVSYNRYGSFEPGKMINRLLTKDSPDGFQEIMEENPNIKDSKEIFVFDCFRNGTNGSRDSQKDNTNNGFIKSDFRQKEILKRRMLYNMTNDTNKIFIPTFLKLDERSSKCRDILTFKEENTIKKISYQIRNYYDKGPFLMLRSLINTKIK